MAKSKQPIVIKKYPTRRLYDTRSSDHITLDDIAAMVKTGDDFVVYDVKSGEDITRHILTQVIFEQEKKLGQNLLPITFLRQLIGFYGDGMQALVRRYLELSMESLSREQENFRRQMSQPLGVSPLSLFEDQVRRNMEMLEGAFAMFTSFVRLSEKMEETERLLPKRGEVNESEDPAGEPRAQHCDEKEDGDK